MPRYVSGSGAADLVKIQADPRYISSSTRTSNISGILNLDSLNINSPTDLNYGLNISGDIGLTGDIYSQPRVPMFKVNNYGQTFFQLLTEQPGPFTNLGCTEDLDTNNDYRWTLTWDYEDIKPLYNLGLANARDKLDRTLPYISSIVIEVNSSDGWLHVQTIEIQSALSYEDHKECDIIKEDYTVQGATIRIYGKNKNLGSYNYSELILNIP